MIKIFPISQDYRNNYDRVFKKACKCCSGPGKIVFGSDTETGTESVPCVSRKVGRGKEIYKET